jgi:hypothetical protein
VEQLLVDHRSAALMGKFSSMLYVSILVASICMSCNVCVQLRVLKNIY